MDSSIFSRLSLETSEKFLKDRKDAQDVDDWRFLLPENHLMDAVEKCAQHLNQTFADQKLLLIPVRKDELCFPSDLLKRLVVPTSVSWIKSSPLSPSEFQDRKVVLLETLFDHGSALNDARNYLISSGVRQENIYTCSLYFKQSKSGTHSFASPDFSALVLPDLRLVGYGTTEKQGWTALYARPKNNGEKVFDSDKAHMEIFMNLLFQLQRS